MKNSDHVYFQATDKYKGALSVLIRTKHSKSKPLLVEDGGKTKALRYASNKESIFEAEQGDNAILESIVIRDGQMPVKASRSNLLAFLRIHPDNVANGGNVFKERDFEAEAKVANEMLDLEDQARDLARELRDDQAEAVHRALIKGTDNLLAKEIRRDLRIFAKNDPITFLSAVDSPTVDMDHIIEKSIEEKLITLRNNKKEVFWNIGDHKKMLIRVPESDNYLSCLKDHFLSSKGKDDLETLEEELSKL